MYFFSRSSIYIIILTNIYYCILFLSEKVVYIIERNLNKEGFISYVSPWSYSIYEDKGWSCLRLHPSPTLPRTLQHIQWIVSILSVMDLLAIKVDCSIDTHVTKPYQSEILHEGRIVTLRDQSDVRFMHITHYISFSNTKIINVNLKFT